MLSKPECGWSYITIGKWSDRCSYIDDVPFVILKGLEQSYKTYSPVSVKFDAEGWEYIIVFDWQETHIITDKNGEYALITVEIGIDELAKQATSDIRREIDDWSVWTDYGDMPDDEKNQRKKDLLALCDSLLKSSEIRIDKQRIV